MAQKTLVVSALGGRIYLASRLKNGTMSHNRTDMTDEVLSAANEWFMINKKKFYYHELKASEETGESKAWVFHTTDNEKAEKIRAILEDD